MRGVRDGFWSISVYNADGFFEEQTTATPTASTTSPRSQTPMARSPSTSAVAARIGTTACRSWTAGTTPSASTGPPEVLDGSGHSLPSSSVNPCGRASRRSRRSPRSRRTSRTASSAIPTAERAPRPASSEDVEEELRAAVDHRGRVGEAGSPVHHAEQLHDAPHPVERAQLGADRAEQLQPGEPCRLAGGDHVEIRTDLAGEELAVGPYRTVAGEEEQRAAAHGRHVEPGAARRRRERETEVCQALLRCTVVHGPDHTAGPEPGLPPLTRAAVDCGDSRTSRSRDAL